MVQRVKKMVKFVQCSRPISKDTKTLAKSKERTSLSMISRYAERGAINSDGLTRAMRYDFVVDRVLIPTNPVSCHDSPNLHFTAP